MGKGLEKTFLQRHTHGQQVYDKMIMRELQMRTTVIYYLILLSIATTKKIKKKEKKSDVENLEKLELFYTAGGNVKWYSHYVKQYGFSNTFK